MPRKKYLINLSDEERTCLAEMTRKGTLKARKLPVPAPNSGGIASGKFIARVPKTVHAQLATRARAEGVSLNTLVLTFIAQGLGRALSPTPDQPDGSPRR